MSFDRNIIERANEVAERAFRDFLSRRNSRRGVVLSSIAGAGKSHFIATSAGRATREGMRIAVCAPTNNQAIGLVEMIARLNPGQLVTFVPARDVVLPPAVASLRNVIEARPASRAMTSNLIVGTFDKLGDAFTRDDLQPVDGLLADESYQADAARYFSVAGLAPTHLLVGDGGQIDPFSPVAAVERWRGLAEDPLQTAIGVLRRNHPETPVH